MRYFFTLAVLLGSFTVLQAQEQYTINLQSSLWSVIPFYILTMATLFLFIWKVIRPQFKTRWIYATAGLALLGALWAVFQFKDIQETQLPAANNQIYEMPENSDTLNLDAYSDYLYEKRQKEVRMQQFANFWVLGIPNLIVIGLCLLLDWRARGQEQVPAGGKRHRYGP